MLRIHPLFLSNLIMMQLGKNNMPQYCYRCGECKYEFEIWHPIQDKLVDCPECEEDALFRIPFFVAKKDRVQKQPGEVVNRTIEEVKKEIAKEKKKIRKKDYKP